MLDISKFRFKKTKKIPKKEDSNIDCSERVMTQNTTIVCRIYGLTSIETCKNCKSKQTY